MHPETNYSPDGGATLCQQYGNAPADITLSDGNLAVTTVRLASTVNWGATNGYVQNKTIHIDDVLLMDIPLIFTNCKFSMGPGAVIRTANGSDFAAYFCKFFCCDYMWKGIEAKGDHLVSLWWCELEDAEIALKVDDVVPTVYLAGNRFNRNHVALTNGSLQAGGNGTLNLAYCFGNTFECASPTNQDYYLYPDKWSQAHIILDHCACSITGGANTPNVFHDAYMGVHLKDADLVIKNAQFTDLKFAYYVGAIFTEWSGPNISGSHILAENCLI